MIRFTLETSTAPIDSALAFLNNIDQEMIEIGEAVLQEVEPELMDELQDLPPSRSYPGDYPIEWTSDLQRKAFFASDGFGGGIPTERNDSLIDSWEILGEATRKTFNLIIKNSQDWSKHVVGSLAKNVQQAARFQQKFHAITGWKLATIPVHKWTAIAQVLFKREFKARWGEAVRGRFRGRAFTTPRRKKK